MTRRAARRPGSVRSPAEPVTPQRQRLRAHLLGRCAIEVVTPTAVVIPRWPGRQPLLVLVRLLVAPAGRLHRETVAGDLWPDADPTTAASRLLPAVLSHLRRGLAEAGDVAGAEAIDFPPDGTIALGAGVDWWSDVVAFRAAVAGGLTAEREGRLAAAAAQLAAACDHYGGPFLPGEEAAWAVEERGRLHERFVQALRELGTIYSRLDLVEEAIDAYRQSLVEEPLQEPVHVALMRLYGRCGRRDLVRRQFQRLCGLLLDALGVEPLPESIDEFHRLMEAGR